MTRKEFYTQAFLAVLPAVIRKADKEIADDDYVEGVVEMSSGIAMLALLEWIKGTDEVDKL